MNQIFADSAREAFNAFHKTEETCDCRCACKRASSSVDLTVYAALHLGGWSYRTLAEELGGCPRA